MDKPASLRKALAASFDVFQKHPDKLHLFITKGTVRGQKGSLSHEERYILNVLITDWTLPMQRITAVIMDWLNIHQPELLRPSELGQFCRAAGLDLQHSRGLEYNPITRRYRLSRDTSVNFMLAARKPPAAG